MQQYINRSEAPVRLNYIRLENFILGLSDKSRLSAKDNMEANLFTAVK